MVRLLVLVMTVMVLTPLVASAQSLKGVWRGTAVRTIGGPNDGLTPLVNRRLLIYTDAFVMWAFDTGTEPRPMLPGPGETSDEEFAAVARQYGSVAGTYIRDGETLIYNRLISLIPNQMTPENARQVREIRLLTANRLETQFTNAAGVTTVLIYQRVE